MVQEEVRTARVYMVKGTVVVARVYMVEGQKARQGFTWWRGQYARRLVGAVRVYMVEG